ncbi:hypothetical protein BH09MYX1_BH09MYX1_68240 [soil metagenome]
MQRALSLRVFFAVTATLGLSEEPAFAEAQPAVDNAPPDFSGLQAEYETKAGERLSFVVRATDPENDPIRYEVRGLPLAARATAGDGGVKVSWGTADSDAGVYPIEVFASDGTSTVSKKIDLVVAEQSESFFVPGVGYELFVPNDTGKLGFMNGFRIEFLAASYVHKNAKPGPSHGRFFVHFDVLFSSKSDVPASFLPTLGFDFSFERNPGRRFLIPFFGLEGGAWFNGQTGSLAFMQPFLGVHLFTKSNVFIGLRGGYFLPFTSEQFDVVRGVRASATVDLSFW